MEVDDPLATVVGVVDEKENETKVVQKEEGHLI